MLRLLIFGLVFISPPFLKKLWLRWGLGAEIDSRAEIGWFSAVAARRIKLGRYAVIRPLTLIRLGGDLSLDDYAEISSFTLVYGSSDLRVGQGSYIGPQCLINADEPVGIGNGSALGPRSMVFTHGSFLPYTEGYWVKLASVTLGDKVWCAAGVFLHPGAEIGDNSFVNSMSVVSGVIPPGSVVEGNPAKVVYPMERVQRRMMSRQVDLVLERILHDFAEYGLRRELGIKAIEAAPRELKFRWRDRPYRVVIVPSTGNAPLSSSQNERLICLVNSTDWQTPPDALALDVPSRTTRFTHDRVHTALRIFLLRYYGMRFTDTA